MVDFRFELDHVVRRGPALRGGYKGAYWAMMRARMRARHRKRARRGQRDRMRR
jgi:hypothetical protein